MVQIFRYEAMLRPHLSVEGALDFLSDVVLVIDAGRILYAGEMSHVPSIYKGDAGNIKVQKGVVMPSTYDAHGHAFQLRWERDELIYQEGECLQGSLISVLRQETLLRNNPAIAKVIAEDLCDRMIDHGIGRAVIHTTSSIPALEIFLQVLCERGYRGRVKAGFVFMDQNVDSFQGTDIEGVQLEVHPEECDAVFMELERLNEAYPGMLTVIDRFPIAVSSNLRRKMVAFCKKTGLDYDTHVDESPREAELTQSLYRGTRIIEVLEADGVFSLNGAGQRVRLAHGLQSQTEDFTILNRARSAGCRIELVACPCSNLNLRSHWVEDAQTGLRDDFVRFPFESWRSVAELKMGIDAGAGLSSSLFQEALMMMVRDPNNSMTWQDMFNMIRDPEALLHEGASADWLVIRPDQPSFLGLQSIISMETLVRQCLVGAASNGGIKEMILDGQKMQSRNEMQRAALHLDAQQLML